jgi:hypothetical protein
MILKIIEDIKNASKVSPNQLYIDLIKRRLDKAVVSYYKDIDRAISSFSNNNKNILSIVKKVVK